MSLGVTACHGRILTGMDMRITGGALRRLIREALMSPDSGAIDAMDRAFAALSGARNEPLVEPYVGRGRPITLGFATMQGASAAMEAFRDGGPAGPALEGLEAAIRHLTPVADSTGSERLLDAIDALRDASEAASLAAHARSSGR